MRFFNLNINISTAIDWWRNRPKHEKNTVKLALYFIIVIALYYALATPLTNRVNHADEGWNTNIELLDWMTPRIQFLKDQKALEPVTPPDNELLDILNKSIVSNDFKNSLVDITTTPEKNIQIKFKAINFDKLNLWLAEQKTKYNIDIRSLSATATNQAGVVDVSFVVGVVNV
jgi:type II secretory pathway component PulM